MKILLLKDIFYNVLSFLDQTDFINLLKVNKKIYFLLFNYKETKNIVFNYDIVSKLQNIETNNYLSNKIISVNNLDKILNSINHVYISENINIEKLSKYNQIKKLIFDDNFNNEIGNNENSFLPKNITTLIFGYNFNQVIGEKNIKYLPDTIEKLILGNNFNQSIGFHCHKFLPKNIKTLVFGDNFNMLFYHGIHNHLVNGLEIIIFGKNFNQYIYFCIPNTVKKIVFGLSFNIKLCNYLNYWYENSIPFVSEITVHQSYNLDYIPSTVKVINLINDSGKIIQTIKR